MPSLRGATARVIGPALNALVVLLLVAGAVAGWLIPRLKPAPRVVLVGALARKLADTHIDGGAYLGADITAMAVIIAVVIGFNVTVLQIAGQMYSLSLARGILRALMPFLLTWSFTTLVALVYFLVPLTYVGQLWQQLAWFAAVVLLMIAYLWDLPWRLSGEYVVRWALRGLRGRPVVEWESIEGYAVIQNAIASAGGRADIATVRSVSLGVGRFLVGYRDVGAEKASAYNRRRYRSLKTLLSGCAQGAGKGPTALAYYIGYLQAGVLLQGVAGGHPTDDADHDLFTGLRTVTRESPDLINALWTGLRHALCRPSDHSTPYLIEFWLEHNTWASDDPRLVERIAVALARFHATCWSELQRGGDPHAGVAQGTEMAIDLYRDIADYLAPTMSHRRHQSSEVRLSDLPLRLLDAAQLGIMQLWPTGTIEGTARVDVVNAYEKYREHLTAAVHQPRA